MKVADWYKVEDPESKCRVFIQRLANDRFSVQYDDDEPIVQTEDELRAIALARDSEGDFRWVPFELLRQHILTAHLDYSFVELSAR